MCIVKISACGKFRIDRSDLQANFVQLYDKTILILCNCAMIVVKIDGFYFIFSVYTVNNNNLCDLSGYVFSVQISKTYKFRNYFLVNSYNQIYRFCRPNLIYTRFLPIQTYDKKRLVDIARDTAVDIVLICFIYGLKPLPNRKGKKRTEICRIENWVNLFSKKKGQTRCQTDLDNGTNKLLLLVSKPLCVQ